MNEESTTKFQIKSLDLTDGIIFVIEEFGKKGEIRLSPEDLLKNKKVLHQFDKKDIKRIIYADTIK